MTNGVPAFAAARFPKAQASEFAELPPKNAETYDTACRYCHVNQQKVPQSYLPLPH